MAFVAFIMLAEVFDEMEKHELRPGLKILTDITDANLKDTHFNTVSLLKSKLEKFLDLYLPVRKTIVAESNLELGTARMYEILAKKSFDVNIFRDKSEAMEWLN